MISILLIDKDDLLRTILRAVWEEGGFIVREASDGLAGLESYRWQPSDLELCDVLCRGWKGWKQFASCVVTQVPARLHRDARAQFDAVFTARKDRADSPAQ